MKDLQKLPYHVPKNLSKEFKTECKKWDKYLKNVFLPFFKKEIGASKYEKITKSVHTKPKDFIYGIRDLKEKARMARQPYFLYFDIQKFYPSVDHKILISKVEEIYLRKRSSEKLKNGRFNKNPKFSRGFKEFLIFLEKFLKLSVFEGKGIVSGTSLGGFLAEVYLYDFFIDLKFHTYRWNDDFVILSRDKDSIENSFRKISKDLFDLKLELSPGKINNGRLFNDSLFFIGFHFKAGSYIGVDERKVEVFLKKVSGIFNLRGPGSKVLDILDERKIELEDKKLSKKIVKLRRLQFGFFYYYRLCTLKGFWLKLGGLVRRIVRLRLFRFKIIWNRKFVIKSSYLYKLGVVDFVGI